MPRRTGWQWSPPKVVAVFRARSVGDRLIHYERTKEVKYAANGPSWLDAKYSPQAHAVK